MKTKIILVVLLALSLLTVVKLAKDKYDHREVVDDLNAKLMEADYKKGKALSKFGNAEKALKQAEEEFQDEVLKWDAKVTRYAQIAARWKAKAKGKAKGTITYV